MFKMRGCRIERNLHAIRVWEPHVLITPRSDNRKLDEGRAMFLQAPESGTQVGHL